jgi:Mn-dependent DtxR family transcriptional regulator
MRRSADWMSIWDDRILEYLQDNGPTAVGEIADDDLIRVSQPHVSNRCAKLAEHGLVSALGNGVYAITERGERYLDEELDAGELADADASEESEESETA